MNEAGLMSVWEKVYDAPDAIGRLRRFVLDLAVRGKLVEQNSYDGTASTLLTRIQSERATWVRKGKAKALKMSADNESAAIFDVPSTWVWTRIGAVTSYVQRGKSPKYADQPGLPVISQRCIQWSGIDFSVARFITCDSISEYENTRFLLHDDILWNSTGTGTIGRVVRVSYPPPRLVCDSHVTVVRCLGVDPEYVRTWLRSDHVYRLIEDQASGSTNQVELTLNMAINQIIPLPPLAEQHRIVTKVDELMTLCDRLEAARLGQEATRDRLAAASLARLNIPDPETFPADARFVLETLPVLTTRPDQIKQLRQTILDMAVRGKLVGQMCAVHQVGAVPAVIKGILPFTLPATWRAVTISEVLDELLTGPFGSSLHQSDYEADGIPVINPASLQGERIVPIPRMSVGIGTLERLASFRVRLGDVVMARRGEMGRCAIVSEAEIGWLCGTGSLILRPSASISGHFLVKVIGSPYGREFLSGSAIGTTMQNLNQGILLRMPFGLPPVKEQHRIVAKVTELMTLCDRLEASLVEGREARRALLEATLRDALAPTMDLADDVAA